MNIESIKAQIEIIEAANVELEISRNQMMQSLDKAGMALDDIKRLLDDNEPNEQLYRTLTVQEVIDKISRLPLRNNFDNLKLIVFDFCGAMPKDIISWRGNYGELAVTFTFNFDPTIAITADKFIEMLQKAIGGRFEGYKGGSYTMTGKTPLWVDNYGCYTSTGILDVIDTDYEVIIQTGRIRS